MGGLFSWLASTDQSDIEKEKEFQEQLVKYQQQIDDFNKNYEQHMIERKEQIQKIYEERKKLIQERIEELIYIDQRYKELKEQRKCINIRASAYICSILFNYYSQNVHDNVIEADGCKFQKEFLQFFDRVVFPKKEKEMNLLVFGQLSQIAPILPLIWPTGRKDTTVHTEYPTNADGTPNMTEHAVAINSYKTKYIRGNLRRYTFNVCYANCYEHMYALNEDDIKEYESACEEYLEKIQECLTNDSFVAETYDFLKKFKKPVDMMRLKMLQAKSRKGISTSAPKLLPPYYPKICPVYELYEAVLMSVNTLCYAYGSIRKNGALVESESELKSSETSHGGKCFELPEKYIKAVYEKCFNMDPNKVWDYTGANFMFVNEANMTVPIEEITGTSDNTVWMKETKVCEDTTLIGVSATDGKGVYKYVNPTRIYTYQINNDEEYPNEFFQLPKMSADMELFRTELLHNLTTTLINAKDAQYGGYSVYNSSYRLFMYSMDYVSTAPSGYELINGISPLSQFVYQMVLVNGLQWNLIFPIDNTMTMSKINRYTTDLVNGDDLVQYIWAGNEKVFNNGHDQRPVTTSPFDMYYVQPIRKSLTWKFNGDSFGWLNQSNVQLLDPDSPAKDKYNMFDA